MAINDAADYLSTHATMCFSTLQRLGSCVCFILHVITGSMSAALSVCVFRQTTEFRDRNVRERDSTRTNELTNAHSMRPTGNISENFSFAKLYSNDRAFSTLTQCAI